MVRFSGSSALLLVLISTYSAAAIAWGICGDGANPTPLKPGCDGDGCIFTCAPTIFPDSGGEGRRQVAAQTINLIDLKTHLLNGDIYSRPDGCDDFYCIVQTVAQQPAMSYSNCPVQCLPCNTVLGKNTSNTDGTLTSAYPALEEAMLTGVKTNITDWKSCQAACIRQSCKLWSYIPKTLDAPAQCYIVRRGDPLAYYRRADNSPSYYSEIMCCDTVSQQSNCKPNDGCDSAECDGGENGVCKHQPKTDEQCIKCYNVTCEPNKIVDYPKISLTVEGGLVETCVYSYQDLQNNVSFPDFFSFSAVGPFLVPDPAKLPPGTPLEDICVGLTMYDPCDRAVCDPNSGLCTHTSIPECTASSCPSAEQPAPCEILYDLKNNCKIRDGVESSKQDADAYCNNYMALFGILPTSDPCQKLECVEATVSWECAYTTITDCHALE